jgi:uroporphyrinogen decarboxylase
LTKKENFIKTLKREPITGHVPHFELVFYLTMESIGKVHPTHRSFWQWDQMSQAEKKAQITDIASTYVEIAKKYDHSAIFIQSSFFDYDQFAAVAEAIRNQSGDEYFIMTHGDPTFPMPGGSNMMEFSAQMYEEPEKLIESAKNSVEGFTNAARKFQENGLLDGFALCSDYCFNVNPFFTNDKFDELIVPFLKDIIANYRSMGFYSIKHTDGNIMPILDQIVDCKPDALHSIDPQGGCKLSEVKRLIGDKVCLIGNVNCGLLQTGTEEECIAEVMRSLKEGMDGYGYIFSTSNCVYTGLPLERYELMHRLWREHGVY